MPVAVHLDDADLPTSGRQMPGQSRVERGKTTFGGWMSAHQAEVDPQTRCLPIIGRFAQTRKPTSRGKSAHSPLTFASVLGGCSGLCTRSSSTIADVDHSDLPRPYQYPVYPVPTRTGASNNPDGVAHLTTVFTRPSTSSLFD